MPRMPRSLMLLTLGLFACKVATVDDDNDASTATPTDPPPELHGTLPPAALPLPSFEATNRDGGVRDQGDLLGHPTVLWFYPLAGSPG